MSFRPGIYRHYKGGYYLGLFVARHSGRDDEVAVYFSLKKRVFWVRPLRRPILEEEDCWNDIIYWPDGERRRRFVYSRLNLILLILLVWAWAALIYWRT